MKKKKLTPEERKKMLEEKTFKRKIVSVFKNTGFEYLNTEGIHKQIGNKKVELDYVFLYENILLICEDTSASSSNVKDHLKNKSIAAKEIAANKEGVIDWLQDKFKDKFSKFDAYDKSNYRIFYLYFPKNRANLSDEDKELYSPILVVEQSSLNYFYKMSQNIKYSARNEIFRFLKISSKDIGSPSSSSSENSIETTIIYPVDNTGLTNGVRLVSFMMSAEKLLQNSFVLRKDNWEESTQLYQRLIEKSRIQSIRQYVARNNRTFFNNIIVSLPAGISFRDKDGTPIKLENINGHESYRMFIPDEVNSICIIDGQHRIYAHYEGDDNLEKIIGPLRKKFHLLVTGLVFPEAMNAWERRKYESEIFLDINSNARPVPPDVLLNIEMLKDPFSDVGVARQVLVSLNKEPIFLNLFQLSLMEKSRIKIASIIKFALKYLVEISDADDRETMYKYWVDDKEKALLQKKDEELLAQYVKFVSAGLKVYFAALKSEYKDDWQDEESKILSITSINGFIIAFRKSLKTFGVKESDFYKDKLKKLSISFSKDDFPYTSSQYNKFSIQILKECFGLDENGDPLT